MIYFDSPLAWIVSKNASTVYQLIFLQSNPHKNLLQNYHEFKCILITYIAIQNFVWFSKNSSIKFSMQLLCLNIICNSPIQGFSAQKSYIILTWLKLFAQMWITQSTHLVFAFKLKYSNYDLPGSKEIIILQLFARILDQV